MKKLLPFLLLPGLVLAQAPEQAPEGEAPDPKGQTPAPPSFDQFKQAMLPIIDKSLPAMKETRECVSQADSKEAVEKCMNAMAEKAKEIQKQSGGEGKEVTSKVPEDFEWTPETKQMMLSNMDRSIKQNTAMQECLSSSGNREEMATCIRAKLPAPKKPRPPLPEK